MNEVEISISLLFYRDRAGADCSDAQWQSLPLPQSIWRGQLQPVGPLLYKH